MKTITEALIEIQNQTHTKVTYQELANVLGYTRQYVSLIKNDKITPKQQQKIEEHYKIDLTLSSNQKENTITLDYYPDVFGSCGNGVFEFSMKKELLTVPKNAFFQKLSNVKKYFVINAYGNSMEPFIFDKDKLIVEHWEGEQIIDNRPYVFCYKDEIFIKRLAKNVNQLVIMPDNKDYDTIKLTESELKEVDIIGQIVGLMRDLR